MKQKQVKASPKAAKQTKTVQKTPKKVPVVVDENEEEEDEVQETVAKKPVNKKVAKAKQVVEEPEEDDQEEDDESAADEDDEESVGEMEDDEEPEDDDDDEDEDETGEETKEEPTIPSKVKTGPINNIPLNKVIHISKLPNHCETRHITEVFGKYGPIEYVKIIKASPSSFGEVAYETSEAVLAAIADSKKVKVLGKPVAVSEKREKKPLVEDLGNNCSITVKNIKVGTTVTELCKHFESCGEISFFKFCKNARPYNNNNVQNALIAFVNRDSVENAAKLHNSILNGKNIKVLHKGPPLEENLTVCLKNKQEFESVDIAVLENIFSQCGEIDHVEVVCSKQILAFVMFKTEEAAQKALELNGKTKKGMELDLAPFTMKKSKTAIAVSNLPLGCTEEDLRNHFSKAGEIAKVRLLKGNAIIHFEDSDGYCKSFMYNETYIKDRSIFIVPHTKRRSLFTAMAPTRPFKIGQKRPFEKPRTHHVENGRNNPFVNGRKNSFENGHTAFRAKKFKQN